MPAPSYQQAAHHLLRGTLVAIGCCLWTGCQDRQDTVTITLWHQMRPSERAALHDEIERFESSHPDVHVEALYKENEELRSGFQAAVLAGVGPELIYGPSDPVGPYQMMGLLQDMTPWISVKEQENFRPEAVTRLPVIGDASREHLLHLGDRVGNHLALVYNQRFVKEPPTTTSEWIQLAKAHTADTDGNGVVDQFGLVWNYIEPYFAIPFLTGHGAWLFQDDGVQPAFTTPQMKAALEFIVALHDQHHVVPDNCDYENADSLFKDGRAAMIVNGDWSWGGYLDNPKIDAAIAPLPVVDATGLPMSPMVDAKGYSLSILADGVQADWAMRFVQYMTSEPTQKRFLRRLRTLPSRTSLYSDPLFRTDPVLRASLAQLERGRRTPVIPELRAIWDGMRPHYQALLGGNATPVQAIQGMQRSSEILIQRMRSRQAPSRHGTAVFFSTILMAAALLCFWQRGPLFQLPSDIARLPIAYVFILPSIIVLCATIIYPFGYNVALSFSNMSLNNYRDWSIIGWQNYRDVFAGWDFLRLLTKTIVWTAVNVFFHAALGVLLAVTLHGPVLGKSIYRILLIVPWAIPSYITALTWRGMFDLHYGAVNRIATNLFGSEPINWLGEENLAFAACLITNIWLGVPFMMVIALGGLQGISQELYEAARMDRASRWTQFWHITVPMLRPILIPALTLGAIWTFNNLNVVWLVSNGGQPADKTHILVSYVYRAVFNLYQFGYGAALSMVIFVLLLAWSMLFLVSTRATEGV